MNNAVTFTKQTSITLQIAGCEPIAGLVEGQTWHGMTEYRCTQGVAILFADRGIGSVLNESMSRFLGGDADPEKATLVSITPALLTQKKEQ